MLKFLVKQGSTHTFKFKMADLIEKSLVSLVEEKYPGGVVLSIDDGKATVSTENTVEVLLDQKDLIAASAESIIRKRLKLGRKKIEIRVGK